MQGFEDIALPLLNSVAGFALSLTRSEADADDLVQETFLRALRGWHTFTVGTDCRRWLFTICRNTFVRLNARSQGGISRLEGDIDGLPSALAYMEAVQDGHQNLLDRMQVGPAIEAAVSALPEPHHSILVLVDLEGMSYEEAAAVLGIPLGTVRSRLYRARRHVQESLVEHARDMGIGSAEPSQPDHPTHLSEDRWTP